MIAECGRLSGEVDELNNRLQLHRAYTDEIQKKLEDALESNRDLLSDRKKVEAMTLRLQSNEEELIKTTESMITYKSQSEVRHNQLIERDRQLGVTISSEPGA